MRAAIDAVSPSVDAGRFPAKSIAGEPVRVEAHCLNDGHDKLRVVLRWQAGTDSEAYEAEMTAQTNDVYRAEFTPPVPGRYRYTVIAWVDQFESWRTELERRGDLNDIRVALQRQCPHLWSGSTRAGRRCRESHGCSGQPPIPERRGR